MSDITKTTKLPAPSKHGPYFTNPYNFVSWKLPPERKDHLYRRPYAPLDRYYGYSGRIVCSLQTLTPFFIPTGQSDGLQEENNGHKTKAFLRLPDPKTGQPVFAIQATSLKGMIRSVVEAATNSCYAVFDPEPHYSHRPLPKPLAMGIVKKADNNWTLEKMESARVKFDLIELYQKKLGRAVAPQERIAAKLQTVETSGRGRSVMLQEATMLKPLGEKEAVPAGFVAGWLKATGRDLIENKKHERFVYPSSGRSRRYTLSNKVVSDYNEVLKEQRKRVELETKPQPSEKVGGNDHPTGNEQKERERQNKNIYKTQLAHWELTDGDIVYFKEEDTKIIALGAVAVPRYLYENSLGEYLPSFLDPCDKIEELCPACRLFGWVSDAHQAQGQRGQANQIAVAGRVFFSHAYVNANELAQELPKRTLAILGTPKPTTTPFYLMNAERPERHVDYNDSPTQVQLRGRKFYWHFNPRLPHKPYLQRQEGDRSNLPQKNDQNSTVELLGEDGPVKFSFTVDFINLDQAELGMLLWALEFDRDQDGGQMRHKLGMGKPIGLGSIQLQIERLELHNRISRYQAEDLFSAPTASEATPVDYQECVAAFKSYMRDVFEVEFDKLYNIKDLRALLNTNSIHNPKEVHYPHLPDTSQPELPDADSKRSESFRWFVQNNRRLKPNRSDPYNLPSPTEEIKGNNYRLPNIP
ncbi:MAG: TIGR03986 family CRISPR-associated RAMP protein [Chloroflexi bacterium]|nr:TIGR03986 family CRISPR-associated RAMP protein [Chloroflexota bacterium]